MSSFLIIKKGLLMSTYMHFLILLLSLNLSASAASVASSKNSDAAHKKSALALAHLKATAHPKHNGLRLLILDTDGKKQYNYRNLIALASNAGFSPSYKSLYDFLESPTVNPADYDALFLIMGVSFLKNIHSEQVKKVLSALQEFSIKPHAIVGLVLPPIVWSESAENAVLAIARYLGLFNNMFREIDLVSPAFSVVEHYLKVALQRDSYNGYVYGTSLLPAKRSVVPESFMPASYKPFEELIMQKNASGLIAKVLPSNKAGFSPTALATLPRSLVIHNPETTTLYFMSKSSEFLFADIEESFLRSPQHLELRDELLEAAQQNLAEFYAICKAQSIIATDQTKRPALPITMQHTYIAAQKKAKNEQIIKAMAPKKYAWIKQQGVSCAWLTGTHDNDFFGDINALGNGINFLYNAQFNLLWFEFNPEWYMLADGTRYKQQKEYLDKIEQIAAALKKKFNDHGKPIPKIFVGSDITSNYASKKVHAAVTDLYGNTYSKIPCPLDYDNFWKIELIDSLDAFIKAVQKSLPIDGIFLDLEMYHAQDQISHYTDLMDYSDFAWNIFCSKTGRADLASITTTQDRVDALAQNQLLNTYIQILSTEMVAVAQKIKAALRSLVPNAMIAAYAMTLPASWFYRSITQGLSSADDPLIFVTFNTDYFSHHQWLVQNNIHLFHGTVVMLSKLQKKTDCALISELLKYHSFIWYNRPSRKAIPHDDKIWWALESTPLDNDELARGISENSK
jgi:hypothetical protein